MEYNSDEYNDLDTFVEESANLSADSGDEAVEDNSLNHTETSEAVTLNEKPQKPKKVVLRPQPKLNFETLRGPKGLLALDELFKDFKFCGNGHEVEDISSVLNKLEQWTYRLFPKFHFEDSLKRIESLGKKREVQVYLRKYRNGLLDDDVIRQEEDDDLDVDQNDQDDTNVPPAIDAFDQLLSQQLAQTPSSHTSTPALTQEQLARIERNRKLALERKFKNPAPTPTPVESESMMDVDPAQTFIDLD